MGKKIVLILACLSVLISSSTAFASDIDIYIYGERVNFEDQETFIDEENRTQVPVRFVSESLGADVDWLEEEQLVKIEKEDTFLELTVGEAEYKKDGQSKEMDTSPVITDKGRTVVPLRFVSEGLGSKVEWAGNINTVFIGNIEDWEVPEYPANVHPVMGNYWEDYEIDKKYIEELGHKDTTLREPNEGADLVASMFFDSRTEGGRQDAARIINRRVQDMDKVNEMIDFVKYTEDPSIEKEFECDNYLITISSGLFYIWEK
ncbi:copper amine oxidase N-terminal domain-containing protein [Natranaerofaba carboxydovora]|uniref:copper amine oxidase N-terminal domain-containing protein n=1 Tax=Natranaerofaba carboxydovora TaxID=2742683 RepID=UPI001F13CA23|nr:copper amine oxidase N-terminal domain-containing protein [Natranaerofaba carboxydovora]UMZ72992.1 Protease inhibitor [Natranaerofaba carboxydovora]